MMSESHNYMYRKYHMQNLNELYLLNLVICVKIFFPRPVCLKITAFSERKTVLLNDLKCSEPY